MHEAHLYMIEKAVRNIARGENAQTFVVGRIQARIVKTLQEEGIVPLTLIEKGYARTIKDIKYLEDKKYGNSRDVGEHKHSR